MQLHGQKIKKDEPLEVIDFNFIHRQLAAHLWAVKKHPSLGFGNRLEYRLLDKILIIFSKNNLEGSWLITQNNYYPTGDAGDDYAQLYALLRSNHWI